MADKSSAKRTQHTTVVGQANPLNYGSVYRYEHQSPPRVELTFRVSQGSTEHVFEFHMTDEAARALATEIHQRTAPAKEGEDS